MRAFFIGAADEGDVVEGVFPRQQAVFLKKVGEALRMVADMTAIGRFESSDQAQNRGFAATGGAEQAGDTAGCKVQGEFVNDGFAAAAVVEAVEGEHQFSQGVMRRRSGSRMRYSIIMMMATLMRTRARMVCASSMARASARREPRPLLAARSSAMMVILTLMPAATISEGKRYCASAGR